VFSQQPLVRHRLEEKGPELKEEANKIFDHAALK
jgi:hypothetical protein